MQHLPQIIAAQRDSSHHYNECFQYVKPFFDSVDLVILNLETTLSPEGPYSGYPRFAAPTALAAALKYAGVDLVMTANNHICDKGLRGIRSTLHALESVALRHTGTFLDSSAYRRDNPLYVHLKGQTLAFLNYTYGTNGLPIPRGVLLNRIDTLQIAQDLKKIARDGADHTILYIHWGEEYGSTPSRYQAELAQWCHDRGADLVIGSHPHVIQPVSITHAADSSINGITAFSLGNFVSNQRRRGTDGGMMLRVEISQRDSLPPFYSPEYLLTWVYTPERDGRRHYLILPTGVADTMLQRFSEAQDTYKRFCSDSRAILNATPEIREATTP